MRAIVISGGVLAVAAVFGLGVVVGRFVLTRDAPAASAPSNGVAGLPGVDAMVGDVNGVSATDPSLAGLPSAPAAPLPPSLPPQTASALPSPPPAVPVPTITARAASDGAMAAAALTSSCNVRVSKDAPVRSWAQKDRVTAIAVGDTCATATVRILLETPQGVALYSLQATARDFGIKGGATADDVRNAITQLLPTDAVRAAAYPQWATGATAPTQSEFSRDTYEAIRAANGPVTCLKMPNTSQRCLANDPSSGQIKVFSRG